MTDSTNTIQAPTAHPSGRRNLILNVDDAFDNMPDMIGDMPGPVDTMLAIEEYTAAYNNLGADSDNEAQKELLVFAVNSGRHALIGNVLLNAVTMLALAHASLVQVFKGRAKDFLKVLDLEILTPEEAKALNELKDAIEKAEGVEASAAQIRSIAYGTGEMGFLDLGALTNGGSHPILGSIPEVARDPATGQGVKKHRILSIAGTYAILELFASMAEDAEDKAAATPECPTDAIDAGSYTAGLDSSADETAAALESVPVQQELPFDANQDHVTDSVGS